MGEAVIDPSMLKVGEETFCIVRLTGGGPAGKLAGSVIQKIPGGEAEDDNKGTICLGLTLSEPLGDGEPCPTLPGTPSSDPRPYKEPPPTGQEEDSHNALDDIGKKASDTLHSFKSKFGGFF